MTSDSSGIAVTRATVAGYGRKSIQPPVLSTGARSLSDIKDIPLSYRLPHAAAVTGHSLRVGMAQDLVAADLDVASVMQAGGWSTPRMVARYTEKLTAHRGAVARFYGTFVRSSTAG
jgi:hypothetical protein